MKNCIVRILGNDLGGIHGEDQTYKNLEFTLLNESDFKNTDKIYILNRIVDREKRERIISLLDKHNSKYLEIKFSKESFNINYGLEDVFKRWKNAEYFRSCLDTTLYVKEIHESLKHLNKYIVNINGARNFALDYCRQRYEWSFILDSNSFLLKEDFNKILINIEKDVEYIVVPQIRIESNSHVFLPERLREYEEKEPQLAFRNTSKIGFNKDLTYGVSDKCELLRVLNVPGVWHKWKDSKVIFGIADRIKEDVKYLIRGKVIRLSHHSKSIDNAKTNFLNRLTGLFVLIKEIKEGKYD
ncbi:MAG: hypothetical protein CMP57_03790 [Flavobacteriales bacterium]|nr:hypothetical protein [Flavobacteriales bacterium]|tara:strand:+ start:56 stop:952 length:897 start_codon:yes stop_codon:yes gene_type:complete